MSTQLLESDFYTVNLQNILKLQNTKTNQETAKTKEDQLDAEQVAETDNAPENPQDQKDSEAGLPKIDIKDWGAELKKRLSKNNALGSGARESEFAVKTKFYKDFYTAIWGKNLAKELIRMGEPLKKTFEVLGFSEGINPIYRFLTLNYVKNELLKTRLLNSNTFKAIYTAVSKRLVADSEFFQVNKYNLIYCRDFYKRSPADMVKYLEIQKSNLSPTASTYKADTLLKNRKIFLHSRANATDSLEAQAEDQKTTSAKNVPEMTDTNAKLNDYDLAEKIYRKINGDTQDNTAVHLTPKGLQEVADKIADKPKALAMIQFLSMTTQSKKAQKALADEKLSGVSTSELLNATKEISGIIKGQLRDADTEYLIDLILNKL